MTFTPSSRTKYALLNRWKTGNLHTEDLPDNINLREAEKRARRSSQNQAVESVVLVRVLIIESAECIYRKGRRSS